jgi:transposase
MRTRKRYTKRFKLEAVRLLEQADKPAVEVARERGVRRNQLYKWKQALAEKGGEAAFRGPGRRV